MQAARRILAAFLFASIITLDAPIARAQATSPPELETFVEAAYPQDALARRAGAEVELEVEIGDDGRVRDARVVAGAGDAFDDAALAAVRGFVFKPALANGQPIASRIRYRYVFTPPPAAIATGRLDGTVRSQATGRPLVGVDVDVTGPDGIAHRTVTDEAGAFQLGDLAPGRYRVRIAALEYGTLVRDEDVDAGELVTVGYRLQPVAAAPGTYGAVATITAPAREITRRSLDASELTKIAGTRGDALRAIEVLPGVGRPPVLSGEILVRGSGHGDSQVFLDGAPVGQLYHFGGLTSFVNGSLLRRVDLYPGNFSVRYGRKLGGIVEAELRDPHADRLHAGLDLNLIDVSALVEGPVADRVTFALGARRSHVDAWLGPALESSGAEVTAAPVYRDWQAILAYQPTAHDRVRLVAYSSSDELALIAGRPGGEMSTQRDRFGTANAMTRLRVDWARKQRRLEQELALTAGARSSQLEAGVDLTSDTDALEVTARGEWRATLARRVRASWGFDVQYTDARIAYRGPRIEQTEGNPREVAFDELPAVSLATTSAWFRPGAYVESTVDVTNALAVTGGLRGDYFGEIEAWALDPRVTARYRLGATTLKAGVGRFSQPPELGQALPGVGNPALGVAHAMHYALGVDHRLGARVSVGLEGYAKQLADLVVDGPDGMLANAGVGRIYGVELAARWQPGGRFSGFLSYAWSRSERNDDGMRWRLFDHDQTHILNAAGTYELGGGWELGGTFRLVSGAPETPVVGSVFDADVGRYRALYGDTNSARKPTFHRLDVRVEKRFALGGHPVSGYLDLQNAYNHRNSEGTAYSYDFSQRRDMPGLPVIPSLGIKGEL